MHWNLTYQMAEFGYTKLDRNISLIAYIYFLQKMMFQF